MARRLEFPALLATVLLAACALCQADEGDEAKRPPLTVAIYHRDKVEIKTLLASGAKPTDGDVILALSSLPPEEWDALFAALGKPDDALVTSAYQELSRNIAQQFPTVEMLVSAFQHLTDLLAKSGANFNARAKDLGYTPLMFVTEKQLPAPIIKALLDVKADPLLKTSSGDTPFDFAARHRNIPLLRLLDQNHKYADLLAEFTIPANSPFVGKWGTSGELQLDPDASGLCGVTMFAGRIAWKQKADGIELEARFQTVNGEKILKATGHLGDNQNTLIFKWANDPQNNLDTSEQKLARTPK